jgi:hypothetical protein
MATSVYLDIDQGSDFTTEITLENDNGTPMNLVGSTVYSQFRKSYGSTTAYAFICAVSNASQGKITLSLPGITSSTIKHGRYLYDVEVIGANNLTKTRVVEGILTLNPEITKIP